MRSIHWAMQAWCLVIVLVGVSLPCVIGCDLGNVPL